MIPRWLIGVLVFFAIAQILHYLQLYKVAQKAGVALLPKDVD